ncbi:MAG TPA: hypothetical protein VHM89_02515 [Acidimicrobiales bacterium]|nr:hypothetical protein [Acidimicrobiales bacterium]
MNMATPVPAGDADQGPGLVSVPGPVPAPAPADVCSDDRGVGAAALAMTRTVLAVVRQAGSVSVSTLGDAVEGPGRALAGRIARVALERPRPVADRAALAAALEADARAPLLGGATAAAVAARVAGRVGPLRFLARRTPMWLVMTAVPAVHASVARGAEELALVASHLVHRGRAAGVEADPERVRRVAAQLLSGAPVNPDAEPRHATLAVAWLQRAVRATLPFSSGVSTRDPAALAASAAAVEPAILAAARPPATGNDT